MEKDRNNSDLDDFGAGGAGDVVRPKGPTGLTGSTDDGTVNVPWWSASDAGRSKRLAALSGTVQSRVQDVGVSCTLDFCGK